MPEQGDRVVIVGHAAPCKSLPCTLRPRSTVCFTDGDSTPVFRVLHDGREHESLSGMLVSGVHPPCRSVPDPNPPRRSSPQ